MNVLDEDDFVVLVEAALETVPVQLAQFIDNVVIAVEDRHETEDLLGLYEGTPLTEREDYGGLAMPDCITLYRIPLCEMSRDREELAHEVAVTVVHELAHHFGIDDDELHRLGWD